MKKYKAITETLKHVNGCFPRAKRGLSDNAFEELDERLKELKEVLDKFFNKDKNDNNNS